MLNTAEKMNRNTPDEKTLREVEYEELKFMRENQNGRFDDAKRRINSPSRHS